MPISRTSARPHPPRFAATAGVFLVLIAFFAIFAAVLPDALAAGSDRKPPTTPTSLRVTATTAYSVSLAWNPSTDDSGNFSYRIRHSWGYEATVPRTQTSYVWTGNVEPGRTYSFFVYVVDAAGNKSKNSNTVTVRMLTDTTPPTKPVITVNHIGRTLVSLSWNATDDGPNIWYTVFKDGVLVSQLGRNTSSTFFFLTPGTTYTFTVQARDFGGNRSPLSDPVSVTTQPSDPNDVIAPTTPTNLFGDWWSDGEVHLSWNMSTDDHDPPAEIRYEVYVNGVLSDLVPGEGSVPGRGRSIVYANVGELNTFEVVAVDSAGNRSPPATLTIFLGN
jgi:fibronectin type 3 domain-containing protein